MNDLLSNPAMQSGVLPALAAALAAALFARTRALVLVPLAGLAVVVWLALGLTLEPLTARSKLVLGVAAAGAIALVLELLQVRARAPARVLLAVLAAAGALWIGVRVLQQLEGVPLWTTTLLLVAYAVAMVEASHAGAGDELRTLTVGVVLGFAFGALGLQGASASVAMMGIALGASCAIGVLALLWRTRAPLGLAFVGLPLAAFAVFAGEVASLTGELPARALAPLPLVALAARWLPPRRQSTPAWRDALVTLLAGAVPAAAALALAVWPRGAASG